MQGYKLSNFDFFIIILGNTVLMLILTYVLVLQ